MASAAGIRQSGDLATNDISRFGACTRPLRLASALPLILLTLPLSGCLTGNGGIFGPDENIPETWPEPAEAKLQPGSRLYFSFGSLATQCTAGFMFRSPDNETLYLSTTAHCLHPRDADGARLGDSRIGDPVYRSPPGGARAIGTVAYDGWAGGQETVARDFALVALSNRVGVRDHAHPAVTQWDGPRGMADPATAVPGQQVFAYGNSIGRDDASQNAKTGRYIANDGGHLYVRLDSDAIQGDSGGPLLTWDGRAFGLLHGEVRLHAGEQPVPEGAEIFTPLAPAVDRARSQVDVALVMWSFDGPETPLGPLPIAQTGPQTGAASLPA